MAHQVFISYASLDKVDAERICRALETAGISCWIAPRDIKPGSDYPTAIVEGVQAARVMVLVLTDAAAASPHIASEVGHAFNGKKRIIPFRISQKPLPEDLEYFLSLTQWLDAPEGCTEPNLKRLVEATRGAMAGESSPHHPVAPQQSMTPWLAAAAVALVAVGAVFYWTLRKPPTPNIPVPTPKIVPEPLPVTPPPIIPLPVTPPSVAKLKTWHNPKDGLNYAWIPAGHFTMGCSVQDSECKDDEKPTHRVEIENGFWMGQTEVTVAAYQRFVPKYTPPLPGMDGNMPVLGVGWAEAKNFCAAMDGRLPTEAEWEYAARAGSPEPYYGTISAIAWYGKNSGDTLHAVGKKQPNAFGLFDMLGNVSEWVLDRYFDKYSLDAAATGPQVEQPLEGNAWAVARGGFWQSDAAALRVSHRLAQEPDGNEIPIGFRCASDHR